MKKFFIAATIMLCMLCSALAFTACGEKSEKPEPEENDEYIIVFDCQEGSSVPSQTVKKGCMIVKPQDPTKEGYSFDAWYIDENFTQKWSFYASVTKSMTLYARWFDPMEGLNYRLVNDYYRVISYDGKNKEAVVPNTYNGKPVKEIGEKAFEDCGKLTSVTIGENIEAIGDCAFYDCEGLESVTIGENVKTIGERAFYACGLESVTIGENVETIGRYAFSDCSRLTEITIPNSVNFIDKYAFFGCDGVKSVIFENIAGWSADGTSISGYTLNNQKDAARYLTSTYCGSAWHRT